MINRQVLEEMGAGAGSQELVHKHVHFLLPPRPSPESCRRDRTSAPPPHPQWLPIPLDEDFSWRRGKEYHDGGNLVYAAKQDEPGMRNQTQNWSWQNIWRVLAARDNTGCVELQMAQNANQQKGFLVLSGLFSEASSFHPVITQVLPEAQSWEMGLFVSYLPGYRNFYRKVPSFLGSILWGVFDVNSPKKQGRRKFSLKKKKKRMRILRIE